MPGTGLAYHPHLLLHDAGPALVGDPPEPYPYSEAEPIAEVPRRVGRIKELLDHFGVTPRLVPLDMGPASIDDVARIHTGEYIQRVLEISVKDGVGDAGQGARLTRGSFELGLLAAGGAIAAVEAVATGRVSNAYALVRPPGHHAISWRGMGFCLFNNIAIAAQKALDEGWAKKILILDWDVHHGNGTQDAFFQESQVLVINLHQDRLYPADSGYIDEVGEGAGTGFNVNVPLPAGTGDAGYLAAIERIVLPMAHQFAPDLILVSSGLDASRSDPLGRMVVSAEGYRKMTRVMMTLADELCGGRLALIHEGGYSQSYAPICGLAIIEELLGIRTPNGMLGTQVQADRLPPTHTVGLDAEAVLAKVLELQRQYWALPAAVSAS
ncbi:MAG: class II histone deacetylase [Chloroflexi bacterium]|nr:class II histone deacetylase [Chloroflexota bacterium]MDA1240149.1 class II histone deacetylase [Chloroflexota bacterium]